nr:nicotinate-nucleotide adenylyltransferase [Paracoccus amoyensis]
MKIGLLGGSFDPAHGGHVNITEIAMRVFRLDRVWWLVTPGNPLKAHGPAPIEQRVAGAQKLLKDPRVVVTDIEARLDTRMTADTIQVLQKIYPGVRFVWLMGSDNLVQFDKWDRWQEIAETIPIGVMARPGSRLAARNSVAANMLQRWRLPVREASTLAFRNPPAWVLINLPMSKLSSTALRQAKEAKK